MTGTPPSIYDAPPKIRTFRDYPPDLASMARDAIEDGSLPPGTFQRLLTIGRYWLESEHGTPVYWQVLEDALQYRHKPEKSRQLTQTTIWSPEEPATLIHSALAGYPASELLSCLPEPDYWNFYALSETIKQQREASGEVISDDIDHEERVRAGLASMTWWAIVAHIRPEIIEHPEEITSSHSISFDRDYPLSPRTMTRRATRATLIHNNALLGLYDEASTGGVARIRPGLGSFAHIQAMLADGNERVWEDYTERTTGTRPEPL